MLYSPTPVQRKIVTILYKSISPNLSSDMRGPKAGLTKKNDRVRHFWLSVPDWIHYLGTISDIKIHPKSYKAIDFLKADNFVR